MRKLVLSIFLLALALPALGQHQVLLCPECRDVTEHPRDYGNHAFNQLIAPIPDDQFGPFSTYATTAYVWNTSGEYALVRLEDVLEQLSVVINYQLFTLPLQVSSDFVEIFVQSMHGDSMTYQVLETSQPLTVGGRLPEPEPDPATETKVATHAAGEELCCQSGTFYWYYDQPQFDIRFDNE